MLLTWYDDYDTGVASIDAQHRELAGLVNALGAAVTAEALPEDMRRALDRLVAFTESHFAHEQALFRQTKYPAAELHTKRHGFLTLILRRFAETAASRQVTGSLNGELVFLRGWLLDHIRKDDRAFGDYVRDMGKR